MAATTAPSGGYYDTGIIDSKAVQDKFPGVFRTIMERLKQQLFANWRNTWVVYDMPELDVISCLQAMRDIRLVKIKVLERIPIRLQARLVQSCDDNYSSTRHSLHRRDLLSTAKNLQYQRKQKTFLLGDLEIETLYRGVDVTEMNSFQLGVGEDENEQLGRYTGGSTFWTHRKETAEGYLNDETLGTTGPTGTTQGVLARTSMSDLIKIADVNTQRILEKFLLEQYKWGDVIRYIVDVFVDRRKLKNYTDFADYVVDALEDDGTEEEILTNLQQKDMNLKYIIGVVEKKIEECIEEAEDGNFVEDIINPDKIWRKPSPRWINKRARPGNVEKFTVDEVWKMTQRRYNAAYLLKQTNEINFTYHPWVTVEEIQRIRHYEVSGQEKDENESAAGGGKRRRLNLVDLFPNLRF